MAAPLNEQRGAELTPDRWKQVDQLMQAALEYAPEERAAFLNSACEGDDALLKEVSSLISLDSEAGSFLEQPALERAAEIVDQGKQPPVIGSSLGRYRVERRIGGGGMGEVYLARDTQLGRPVALKVLTVALTSSAESRTRFLREARLASALDHPNICTIHEAGEASGRHFIAMQYVEGRTLKEVIGGAPLDLNSLFSIGLQVAEALRSAHAHGIIHRDIKSSNIMISPTGHAKVLDFGLAKSLENAGAMSISEARTELTLTGAAMGTPAYMSPEQARGEAADYRSDIFSFAVVLYEMATGRLPFKEASQAETMNAIINQPHQPAITLNQELPAELSAVIDRALSKRPADRFQSMETMIVELRSSARASGLVSSGSPDGAVVPYPTPRRRTLLMKLKRSRRLLVALATFFLLAAAAYYLVRSRTRSPAEAHIKTLAVLPFRSLDQEAKDAYLGLGIATDIITRVSQSGELTVRPSSAVHKYVNQEIDALEAARELKVDAVLDGAFLHMGDRLRVTVNLLKVEDGASLWAEKFDEQFTDLFAIQDKVSQQVAQRLRLSLSPAEQARFTKRYTSNAEAYNYYAKAMYHFGNISPSLKSRAEADLAVDLFKKAIDLDSKYALAHAQLGYTYVRIAVFLEYNRALIEQAEKQLAVAESLDPQLAEVHVARYFILFSQYEGWQAETAVRELRLAEQLSPNISHFGLGDVYGHIGLEKQAVEEFERALKVDPNDDQIKNGYVNAFYITGRPDEALEASRKFLNHGPDYRYYVEKGMVKEAWRLIEAEAQRDHGATWLPLNEALLLALEGKHREAEAAVTSSLEKERNYRGYHHDTYYIARIFALAGKSDEALKWLRVTVNEGFPCYPLFVRDRFLDPIRKDRGFVEFMEEMKARWENYQLEFG